MNTLKEKIIEELDVKRSMNHIRWLTENTPHRISGTGQDRTAAEYIVNEMKSYGCEAKLLEFETYNSRLGTSEMTLLTPEKKVIESMPCCHIEPTSPEGDIYELIYVGAGGEEDYKGKDVKGKAVLVEVSYAPATPEKAMIAYRKGAKAMICMNWGRKDENVICMRGLKGVWGNPTTESFGKIPKISGCSITRKDGEYLRNLYLSGEKIEVKLKITAQRLWEKLPQPIGIVKGKEEPEKFLLVTGHLDAWDPGVTCNATGDATMLEMVRVFSKFKDELKRSIWFVFWNGHEIAEAAGSTWFADNYWDQLSDNCIGYINIDSTGMKYADEYEVDVSRELSEYSAETVKEAIGHIVDARPMAKIADQSFFGMGIPSVFGRVGFKKEIIEENHGATLGWWNHTVKDGLDKVDENNMELDNKVQALSLLGMVNSVILPYNFDKTAKDIYEKLKNFEPYAKDTVDITALVRESATLVDNVEKLNSVIAGYDEENKNADKINAVLMKLSRTLTSPFYTACDRYSQDSYGLSILSKPIPALYPIVEMSKMSDEDTEFKLLRTEMLRNRNRLLDSLKDANEYILSVVK
ncbi:MAG: M28 family peptidase [Anaerovoracaceae bacterium]|nr:M28 family peptidase [Bacillota bacterium]MEE0517402.1 M28 family peptidase [Anaerovoracaceae bacterium]